MPYVFGNYELDDQLYELHCGGAPVEKEVDVRAEAAEVLRINPKFSVEMMKQALPLKDPAAYEWYWATLRKAGLK